MWNMSDIEYSDVVSSYGILMVNQHSHEQIEGVVKTSLQLRGYRNMFLRSSNNQSVLALLGCKITFL